MVHKFIVMNTKSEFTDLCQILVLRTSLNCNWLQSLGMSIWWSLKQVCLLSRVRPPSSEHVLGGEGTFYHHARCIPLWLFPGTECGFGSFSKPASSKTPPHPCLDSRRHCCTRGTSCNGRRSLCVSLKALGPLGKRHSVLQARWRWVGAWCLWSNLHGEARENHNWSTQTDHGGCALHQIQVSHLILWYFRR